MNFGCTLSAPRAQGPRAFDKERWQPGQYPGGVLEFDYVSTNVNHRMSGAPPMPAATFRLLVFELLHVSYFIAVASDAVRARPADVPAHMRVEEVAADDTPEEAAAKEAKATRLHWAAGVFQARWRSYKAQARFIRRMAMKQVRAAGRAGQLSAQCRATPPPPHGTARLSASWPQICRVWSAKCPNWSIVTRAHAPRQIDEAKRGRIVHSLMRSLGLGEAQLTLN